MFWFEDTIALFGYKNFKIFLSMNLFEESENVRFRAFNLF
jgi:hypothetical protein